MPRKPLAFEFNDTIRARMISTYQDGIGIKGLMARFGCGQPFAESVIRDAGIKLRNRREQQTIRMARADAAARKALVAKANAAALGRKCSSEERALMARTCEERGSRRRSAYEDQLAQMLRDRDIVCQQQTAIGPYNCDLTSGCVAVEVLGGKWHWHGEHLRRSKERTHHILNAGWHLLMVAVYDTWPLTPEVADYVAAYIKSACAGPTACREYRVIWGAAEYTVSGRADDENFSIMPPFTNRRNRVNGRYGRVAKDAPPMAGDTVN